MAITVGDAVMKLGLDSTQFDQSMSTLQTKVTSGFQKLQQNIVPISAGMAAIGAVGLKMADTARQMNAQLGQTGLTMGKTTAEMRKLALETTNVTFPLKSVLATFDLLARAGIRDETTLKAAANAFDALADATGSSAETLADQLIPAYKLFGLELPKTAAEMDKFTWLTRNSTIDISDFATSMTYVARSGNSLGLTLEDMIATMKALEDKGISGSAATMTFRTAITEAENSGKGLNEVLGLSQTAIDGYKKALADATGITDANAAMLNSQYGIMDKLKQKWEELSLSVGSFIIPVESVMAGMTALSTLILALNVLHLPKLIGLLGGAGSAGLFGVFGLVAAAAAVLFNTIFKYWDDLDKRIQRILAWTTLPGFIQYLRKGYTEGGAMPEWPEMPSEFMEGAAGRLAGATAGAGTSANVTNLKLDIENFYGDEESKAALARYLEEELAKLQRLGG